MRDLKLWAAAAAIETILMVLYILHQSGSESLAGALWSLATQLPSVPISNFLLPESAPQILFYVVTFVFQTVFISMMLHLVKAALKKCKSTRD